MPKVIDHRKRKKNILNKAVEVFGRNGYRNTSFTDIAEAAALSRATLYQYFHDKDQILFFAIKEFTDHYLDHYEKIAAGGRPPTERLREITHDIVNSCYQHRREVLALIDILANRESDSYGLIVKKRSARLRRILSSLLFAGKKTGQLSKTAKESGTEETINTFFSILVGAVVQMAINPEFDFNACYRTIDSYVDLIGD